MGKEASYIQAVNKHLPLEIHSEGMANPYRGGTPDRYYEYSSGRSLWVEYKYFEKLPPTIDLLRHTAKTKPILSKLQQEWLTRSHENNHSVAVIVGSPEGGLILPGLAWQKPVPRESFRELMRPKKEILALDRAVRYRGCQVSMERRYFAVELYHRDTPIEKNARAYTVTGYTPYDAAQSVVAKCSDTVLDPGTKRGPTHWWFIGRDDEDRQVLTIVHELFL